MKPKEQRIAIAKSVGIHLHDGDHAPSNYTFVTDLPDYLNDLNAMHEAETVMTDQQRTGYLDKLYEVCNSHSMLNDDWNLTCATAAQRAEAFLRTIGKWTTNPNEL